MCVCVCVCMCVCVRVCVIKAQSIQMNTLQTGLIGIWREIVERIISDPILYVYQ